jgi:hypothetical protein
MINRSKANVNINNLKLIHDKQYDTTVIFNRACAWFLFVVAVLI